MVQHQHAHEATTAIPEPRGEEMPTLSRHVKSAASLLFMLGMMTLAASSPSTAQGVCPGFDRKHTITRLGGANALAPGGGHSRTRAELQAYFAANAETIRAVLTSRGLSTEVANALLDAVRQGTGITERAMPEGERLQWMAYRKNGNVTTIENVCLNLPGAAPAFEITVPVVTATETTRPDCSIDVTTDLQPDGTGTLRVRTAPGARVTMEGPGGARTIIEGGASTWSGPWDDPYRADYAFTVTNEGATTDAITSYTFLVPRECLNLALVVEEPKQQRVSRPETCTERRTVPRPVPPPPKPPSCNVVLDLTQAHRGDVVGYQVTGEWTRLDLQVLLDGVPLTTPHLTGPRGTLALTRRGTYTIVATTTNEPSDSKICRASVEVGGADWIVRPIAAYLVTDGETSGTVNPGSCPCPARTNYGYDDGYGLGLGVERRFSERFGVEARALYGRLDEKLWIGANGIGITERDRRHYWDLSIGLNIHLTPKGSLDWYAGPFVGYSKVDGHKFLVVDRSLEYDTKGALTWGAQTGLDWPFGRSPWSLHGGARYTRYAPDVTQRQTQPNGAVLEQRKSIDLNPITFELGVAYHF
jgi:outer membrane protein W